MSSHHFVKEGQEPALIIADVVSFTEAAPLLEWAPLVVVTESALDHFLSWGVKSDAVTAKVENIGIIEEKVAHQKPVEILVEKKSDLETAFQFLITKNQHAANIFSDSFERDLPVLQKWHPLINMTVFCESIKWSQIPTGLLRKWYPPHSSIQVLGSEPVSIQNELKAARCSFQSDREGMIEIKSGSGFWIGEPFN